VLYGHRTGRPVRHGGFYPESSPFHEASSSGGIGWLTLRRERRTTSTDAGSGGKKSPTSASVGVGALGSVSLPFGSNDDMKAVTGKNTKVVNLGGKMVMPGLIDTHIHALRGALTNRGGQVLRLVQSWDDDDLSGVWRVDRWDAIEALTVWGGFAGDSGFEGTVNLLSRESWTAAQAEALQRALQSQAERTGMSIDVRVSPVDEGLRIEYRLNDLVALLDRLQN